MVCMNIPKAFISYSHDSQDHKKWVLDLATRLRNSGVDSIIDLWDLKPGDDLPQFMEKNLTQSDYIIMVCSDEYVRKANSGIGGVGYEKMIITSEFMDSIDSNKIIPIIRQNGTCEVPIFIKTKLFIDFSVGNSFEYSFDELVRTLLGAPLFVKPEIGNNPFKPIEEIRPERTGDALKELMCCVVSDFNEGNDYSNYYSVVHRSGISRIFLDSLIEEAKSQDLLEQDSVKDLILTEKGKFYAIEHDIANK